jgi:NADPH:quinone reductase-like Zn-dependent oxidoreductase
VLLKMKAWSLNYRDLLVAKGLYNPRLKLPFVPLSDGVGDVIGVGDGVTRVKIGERVAGCFMSRWIAGALTDAGAKSGLGGNIEGIAAEQVVLHEDAVVHVPTHLSDEEAATLPCAALTAWNATMVSGRSVKPGDTVLCQGSGGVSLFTALFAKAAGARVILMSSSDEKLERASGFLRDQDPDDCINYLSTPEWQDELLRLTQGRGADHIMELGGAATLSRSYAALAFGGRIALIGFRPDATGDCNPYLLMMKDGHIDGVGVGSALMFENMNRAIEQNGIKPPIDRVFEMEDTVEAVRLMGSSTFVGKIVVRV